MANTYHNTATISSRFFKNNTAGLGISGIVTATNWYSAHGNIGNASNITPTAMSVKGDLDVGGALKVKGKDLIKLMEKIEDRLAILAEPDPMKLEKFAALKKAYDHYKLMEKIIGDD
jgi:hypothetical protein